MWVRTCAVRTCAVRTWVGTCVRRCVGGCVHSVSFIVPCNFTKAMHILRIKYMYMYVTLFRISTYLKEYYTFHCCNWGMEKASWLWKMVLRSLQRGYRGDQHTNSLVVIRNSVFNGKPQLIEGTNKVGLFLSIENHIPFHCLNAF